MEIIMKRKVPAGWSHSIIDSLFKRNEDALDRSNYRGMRWTNHVLEIKVIERVVENIIRKTVNNAKMQFGFCSGRSTTEAIFILRQLQGKYLAKHRKLYIAFVYLRKAFNRVPRKVLWWALHVVSVLEWLVKVLQLCIWVP